MAPAAIPVGSDADAAKMAVWKESLYERCRETAAENDFLTQDDLIALGVIPNDDLSLLARVVQSLSDDKLFVTMRESSGAVLWKWRDAQEAHKCVPISSLAIARHALLTKFSAGTSCALPTSRPWCTP